MNINYSRYMDSVGAGGIKKKTLLNRWYRSNMRILWNSLYDEEKKNNPYRDHPILCWIASIPFHFECWLCCGFKWWKDNDGRRTWKDNYHMVDKLCRYETWKNVRITWWDKIRFKIITGYDFE